MSSPGQAAPSARPVRRQAYRKCQHLDCTTGSLNGKLDKKQASPVDGQVYRGNPETIGQGAEVGTCIDVACPRGISCWASSSRSFTPSMSLRGGHPFPSTCSNHMHDWRIRQSCRHILPVPPKGRERGTTLPTSSHDNKPGRPRLRPRPESSAVWSFGHTKVPRRTGCISRWWNLLESV